MGPLIRTLVGEVSVGASRRRLAGMQAGDEIDRREWNRLRTYGKSRSRTIDSNYPGKEFPIIVDATWTRKSTFQVSPIPEGGLKMIGIRSGPAN